MAKTYIVFTKKPGESWKEDSPWNTREAALNAANKAGAGGRCQTKISVRKSPDRPFRWNRED